VQPGEYSCTCAFFGRAESTRQCALIRRHIGATWWIPFNRSSAAALRFYVKWLWPLFPYWCSDVCQLCF